MNDQNCTRREFFVGAVKVAAVAGIATVIAPSVGAKEAAAAVKSVSVDLTVAANKPLDTLGGSIMIDNPNDKKGKIILYRKSSTEVIAFNSKCPHVGGPLKLPDEKGVMLCEWHKATFDIEGTATFGPTKKPLQKFVAKITGSSVVVTL